jgi:hypothetical protein
VAVVAPSATPPAPAVVTDGGTDTTPLLVAGAVAAGLAVLAYVLVRRGR